MLRHFGSHEKVPDPGTVRRYYRAWRKANGPPPDRCDNPECCFHTKPMIWNGRPLPQILDHTAGNRRWNGPQDLRYLCPNCDAQQSETRGGANAGLNQDYPGGSARRDRKTGLRHHTLAADAGHIVITFGGSRR